MNEKKKKERQKENENEKEKGRYNRSYMLQPCQVRSFYFNLTLYVYIFSLYHVQNYRFIIFSIS